MDINLTLFGEMITFLLFVIFTMKFVWPPIVKAMEARQKTIADGLEAAERGKHELELAKGRSVGILHESKAEAAHILEQANVRADQLIHEAKGIGKNESKRIVDDAQIEIAQEVARAKDTLRADFADVVIKSAEKILEKEIDKSAHENLINELIVEIK